MRVGLVLLVCCLSIGVTAAAAVYVVAPDGNDAGPGSLDLPWRTIQHAADTVVAGDTVWIRDGIYNELIALRRSGDPGAPIVFAAYENEAPVIDGTGLETGALVRLEGVGHVVLQGLEIRNVPGGNAVWIARSFEIELIDCDVHHAFYGIGIADGTHHFTLTGIVVHDIMLYGIDVDAAGGDPCSNGTFNDCVVHTASDPSQNVDGFALGHGEQHSFVFNRCRTVGVYDGFDISARHTELNGCWASECVNGGYKIWQDDVRLVNCVAFDNGISNLELDWDGESGTVTLDHCTMVGAEVFNIWVENAQDRLRMTNCIVAGSDNIGLAFEQHSSDGYVGDYNLFHTTSGGRAIAVGYRDEFSTDEVDAGSWASYAGQDRHSSSFAGSLESLFVDVANGDLRLVDGGLAVDSGASSSVLVDFDGHVRPVDGDGDGHAGPDLGAFEFQG